MSPYVWSKSEKWRVHSDMTRRTLRRHAMRSTWKVDAAGSSADRRRYSASDTSLRPSDSSRNRRLPRSIESATLAGPVSGGAPTCTHPPPDIGSSLLPTPSSVNRALAAPSGGVDEVMSDRSSPPLGGRKLELGRGGCADSDPDRRWRAVRMAASTLVAPRIRSRTASMSVMWAMSVFTNSHTSTLSRAAWTSSTEGAASGTCLVGTTTSITGTRVTSKTATCPCHEKRRTWSVCPAQPQHSHSKRPELSSTVSRYLPKEMDQRADDRISAGAEQAPCLVHTDQV
mmetsp:Transcript_13911/g.43811  ORF Transcript_13911/g.43811 Transcript_13911/m.43811 type:complete len:285 (+) Transcript_13911:679-1533(+)